MFKFSIYLFGVALATILSAANNPTVAAQLQASNDLKGALSQGDLIAYEPTAQIDSHSLEPANLFYPISSVIVLPFLLLFDK